MATFKGFDAIQKKQAENVARQKNIVAKRKGSRSKTYVVTTSDGRSFTRTTTPTKQGSVFTQGGVKRVETFIPKNGGGFSDRTRQLTPSQKRVILQQQQQANKLRAQLKQEQISEAKRKAVVSKFPALNSVKANSLEITRLQTEIKRIEKAPYKDFVRKELTQVLLSKYKKSKFGSVNIQGVEYEARTKAEKTFLENLKKYLNTESAIAKKINDDFSKRNINVREGDQWWVRALKGSGQAVGGLRYSPLQIGNLIAKGKIFRLSRKSAKSLGKAGFYNAQSSQKNLVKQEKVRSLKAVPGEVGRSFDPRKPENWFNIATTVLLFAMSVKPVKMRTVTSVTKTRVRLQAKKVQVSQAQAFAKKALRTSKGTQKRLIQKRLVKLDASAKQVTVRTKEVVALEKTIRSLNRASKMQRKILRGDSLKANRGYHISINGKKHWVFSDRITGNVRYFDSYKQWFKAVKGQERLIKTGSVKQAVRSVRKAGVKKPKISVSEAKKIKSRQLQLRKEMNIVNKQKRGLLVKTERSNFIVRGGKKQYPFYDVKTGSTRYFDSFKRWNKAVKLQAKATPKRLGTRVSREFRVLFDKTTPRPLQTKVRSLVVREKTSPPVITVTQSPSKIAVVVKKPGSNIYTMKQVINKPKKVSGGVEIKTGNGKTLLMAPLETVKKLKLNPSQLKTIQRFGLVKITKTKTVIITKKTALLNVNKYYGLLLSQSNRGLNLQKALKNNVLSKLHNSFFPLLTSGKVKTVLVNKQSFKQSGLLKQSVKQRLSNKTKQVTKTKQITKTIVRQRTAIKQKQALRELTKLKTQLKDRVKRKLNLRKIPTVKIKKKFPKKDLEELFKWVKKQKSVYRPSLYAILLGIVGKQPKSITGFEIRPILRRKK